MRGKFLGHMCILGRGAARRKRQGKARPSEARQGKARQGNARREGGEGGEGRDVAEKNENPPSRSGGTYIQTSGITISTNKYDGKL